MSMGSSDVKLQYIDDDPDSYTGSMGMGGGRGGAGPAMGGNEPTGESGGNPPVRPDDSEEKTGI